MTYILVVDDEQEIAELLGDILDDEGYTVRCAHTALAALAIAEEHPPKLILFDMTLPDLDGTDFINRYRSLAGPPVPLVALSGIADLRAQAIRDRHAAGDHRWGAGPTERHALRPIVAAGSRVDRIRASCPA